MRVLFWSGPFWPHIGGVEVLAARLLPALRRRGHEYIVVTSQNGPDSPDEASYEGIPVYRFPFMDSMTKIDQLVEIRQQVAELKRTFAPDLIHVNSVNRIDFFHHLTAHAHPAPVLVTLHGLSRAEELMARTLRNADWVVGCSAAILGEGRRLVPEITRRSSVIYNALDQPSLPPEPLPTQEPRLLCLGRLAPVKGVDLALRALASIAGRFPEVRLVVAGDGPERTRLEQQAVELGLGRVVEFTGWIAPDDIPALMNTVTIAVIPSRSESFSLVALEAALMARPVVAAHVGGIPEVVVHQQTGLLVEPENSDALAEAMAFLLDHSATATRMGQAARRRAQRVFSWERQVHAYDALYRRLVKGRRRSSSTPLQQD